MNRVNALKGKFIAQQVKAIQWVKGKIELVHNQRGAEAIEWLALVAVIVAILAFVLTKKDAIGGAIADKITAFIDKIKVD